jgi:hypothetical protein
MGHGHSRIDVAEMNGFRKSKCCAFVRFSPRLLKSRLLTFSHLRIGAGHEKQKGEKAGLALRRRPGTS